jgi:methyl-accepting chemotaxis protein PixJ
MATPDSLKDSTEVMTTRNQSPSAYSEINRTQEGWWQKLGLRTKATLLAIALGTMPVVGIGSLAYYFAGQSMTKQVATAEDARAVGMADKVNRFMFERYGDIQVLAVQSAFSNSKVRASLSKAEKDSILDKYVKTYLVYESIAVFDTDGNEMARSSGPELSNHKDRTYFQNALKTGSAVISQPEVSKTTGKVVIHTAAPIKDQSTGQIIGVVRARMPVNAIEEVIKNFNINGEQYHLVDASGTFFLAAEKGQVGRSAKNDFVEIAQRMTAKQAGTEFGIDRLTNAQQMISYAPFKKLEGLPDLQWDSIIAVDKVIALRAQQQLALILGLGTLAAAAVVAAIAAYLASRATRPIIQSSETVEKIGQGDLSARIDIKGQDELATLGENINLMAEQIQDSLRQQEEAAKAQLEAQAEIARQQEEAAKAQLEAQTEIARQQAEAAEQARQRNEALQMELLTLLQDVEGASSGDLTVRADVSAGEIGIVADFFNAIVESLREIVSQVKQASAQVNDSIGSNETVMGQLAEEAQTQAGQITETLGSVEQMALSIQKVAENARMAATVSEKASKTAEMGGKTMDRTVDSIMGLRETVAETAKKVKRLGESSQQISKAVSLINQIALQTNLLAINASIEAARAGEEGRGFAVVAEEVGALAAQSAAATKEIEVIVDNIQRETSEVVDAMESGTTQVVEGTRQVEEAKESLNQIVKVSREIDELLQSISSATVSQAATSQVVKTLMEQITETSERTSDTSRQVSTSLQETVGIAQKLQSSVATFKVQA